MQMIRPPSIDTGLEDVSQFTPDVGDIGRIVSNLGLQIGAQQERTQRTNLALLQSGAEAQQNSLQMLAETHQAAATARRDEAAQVAQALKAAVEIESLRINTEAAALNLQKQREDWAEMKQARAATREFAPQLALMDKYSFSGDMPQLLQATESLMSNEKFKDLPSELRKQVSETAARASQYKIDVDPGRSVSLTEVRRDAMDPNSGSRVKSLAALVANSPSGDIAQRLVAEAGLSAGDQIKMNDHLKKLREFDPMKLAAFNNGEKVELDKRRRDELAALPPNAPYSQVAGINVKYDDLIMRAKADALGRAYNPWEMSDTPVIPPDQIGNAVDGATGINQDYLRARAALSERLAAVSSEVSEDNKGVWDRTRRQIKSDVLSILPGFLGGTVAATTGYRGATGALSTRLFAEAQQASQKAATLAAAARTPEQKVAAKAAAKLASELAVAARAGGVGGTSIAARSLATLRGGASIVGRASPYLAAIGAGKYAITLGSEAEAEQDLISGVQTKLTSAKNNLERFVSAAYAGRPIDPQMLQRAGEALDVVNTFADTAGTKGLSFGDFFTPEVARRVEYLLSSSQAIPMSFSGGQQQSTLYPTPNSGSTPAVGSTKVVSYKGKPMSVTITPEIQQKIADGTFTLVPGS